MNRVTIFSPSVSLLVGMICIVASGSLYANEDDLQLGFEFYQSQQFNESLEHYQQANSQRPDLVALMGMGSSAYRLQDSIVAVQAFKQAAVIAKTAEQRAQALFNLGNSYMQLQAFDYAVEAYQQALVYRPGFSKAQHNLAIAQQQSVQMTQQRNGRNGEGERGESGQGQGAGERAGKLDLDQNFIGGAGESNDAGESPQEQAILPQQRSQIEVGLQADAQEVRLNSNVQSIHKVHQQTANRQQAQRFLLELKGKDLNQQLLLKRLLEREAGFFADQAQPHEIPGVDPW